MDILRRNKVVVTGNPDGPAVVLAHGFGCDQNRWRLTVPLWPRSTGWCFSTTPAPAGPICRPSTSPRYATGILMERFDLDDTRAFEILGRYSQENNIKLREVAQELVGTRRLRELR